MQRATATQREQRDPVLDRDGSGGSSDGQADGATRRVARLLTTLGSGRASLGLPLADVARATGLHKSTALRLLTSLEAEGLVERLSDGRYRIGSKLVEVVCAYLDDHDVIEQAHPIMRRLAAEVDETIHLAQLRGIEIVYIDKVESSQSLRMVSTVGSRHPAYCTALGKAIIACADAATVDQVISAGLEQRTPQTIVDPEVLRENLKRVQNLGYAVDEQENRAGIYCVAAEIRDRRGRVVAGISISGPSVRLESLGIERAGRIIRGAADAVSRSLGYEALVAVERASTFGDAEMDGLGHG